MRRNARPNPKSGKIREWLEAEDYQICIHNIVEQEYIFSHKRKLVVYIEVEYRNQTQLENMSCRRNQWHLFMRDGYSFEALSELRKAIYYHERPYFGSERYINPGRNVRGWLAFEIPLDAGVQYIQFMTAFLKTNTVEIDITDRDIQKDPPVDLSYSR
jgi:hypothetical protein